MNEYDEIGARLRVLRESGDCSVAELASELGLDPDVYASYEMGGGDVPISVLYAVANKFGVDFTELATGQPARLETYNLIRRGGGKVVNRNPEYHFEDLAYRYTNKIMQPLLVTLEPTDKPAKLITHTGQEFNLVLEGTVIITLGDREFVMTPGDSIYFNPTIPHGQRCGGDVKARFLTVISE
ncbi:MAG: cupin domain-containing protein [Clostridia bacterium]|nr:cupin domain-containing protein [Clostridia bacterium]